MDIQHFGFDKVWGKLFGIPNPERHLAATARTDVCKAARAGLAVKILRPSLHFKI